VIKSDVLIIGAGIAGLRAAVGISHKYDTAVLSKVHPVRSHSIAAQGGMNATLANVEGSKDDTFEKHTFDTIKGSDYLADQSAVRVMCEQAPLLVYELEHWGCPWSRLEDGRIAQRPFGGAGYPRCCYSTDRTGHMVLHTLYEKAMELGVKVYEEWLALSLAVDNDGIHGVVAMEMATGRVESFAAKPLVDTVDSFHAPVTPSLIQDQVLPSPTRQGCRLKIWSSSSFTPQPFLAQIS
jgi:succinate dehydrogenase / fumarate reductase flavoprotein subunit